MMTKKSGNFIEQHIEKAILGIAVLVSGFLLYKFVLVSPNTFTYGGKKLSSGQLDTCINDEAQELRKRLNEEAISKKAYDPKLNVFLAKMNSTVAIDANIEWPLPSSIEMRVDKKYRIPAVGAVKDIAAEYIRAAAYLPKAEITIENADQQESYEPNDLDLVSVQATFDAGEIANSFSECFAGKDLPEDWRDENLSRPVFAAVDLQRQQMGADGTWGGWESIPRERIDPRREEFRKIEDVNNLPSGSIMVRMLRFSGQQTQASLLQPEPYQIASSEEEWYPPLLHKRYLANRREKDLQERREHIAAAQEEQAQEREKTKTGRDASRTKTTTGRGAPGPAGGGGGGEGDYMRMLTGGDTGSPGTTTKRRTEREKRTEQGPSLVEQARKTAKPDAEAVIYDELKKMLLSGKEISKLNEPIVFWSHDDTVEPGNTYRYRIRLGVFNPVAGTGQVRAEDADYDSSVILWSKYSDVTEPVQIPQRLYFFPLGVQEASKGVEVQVYKYALGYWYSTQFMVKRGDEIGKAVKTEPSTADKSKAKGKDAEKTKEEETNLTLPEMVDYTTGAIVMDVTAVSDWSGDKTLAQRQYYEMLYSYDGDTIERMATKQVLWPEEIRARYAEIRAQEKRPKLAFRAWSNTSVLGQQRIFRGIPTKTTSPRPGEGQMSQDEMMYMMMLQGAPQK